MKRLLALALSALLLTACVGAGATDLMTDITPAAAKSDAVTEADASAIAELALVLLRDPTMAGASALVSPLSITAALGMTANGAVGDTLAGMEAVLGLPRDRINTLMAGLPRDGEATLKLANGIWFRDEDLTVKPEFLQRNADFYGAGAQMAPMNDATRRAVNTFIEEKTAGMIRDMLAPGSVTADTALLLVNALAFEAEWQEIYEKHQVREGDFHRADGETVTVDFMHSQESRYLADDRATGFIKYYKGREYAFAAILPNEGVTLDDYLAGLDGAQLVDMLASAQSAAVITAMPKFEGAYSYQLNDALSRAGMDAAFDPARADFSAMAESSRSPNIWINFVQHNTFIQVAEKGTRAGAATVVAMTDGAAMIEEPKRVTLDRPFLYAIIDAETNLPVFVGTMCDPRVK